MKSTRYSIDRLIGNQLHGTPWRGTGRFGAVDLAGLGAGGNGMPGVHGSAGAPLARGLPGEGVPPRVPGGAHAHRPDFQQDAIAVSDAGFAGLDAPDLHNLPGVGVREEWERLFGEAVAEGRAVYPLPAGVGVLFTANEETVSRYLDAAACGGLVSVTFDDDGMSVRVIRPEEIYAAVEDVRKRTPCALRAPGDLGGAGARACAPALPRGNRAARNRSEEQQNV